MTESLILLTPLVLLLIVALFGFTGCKSFGSSPADPPATTPGTPPGTPPAGGVPYADIVKNTPGFVGHWGFNETSGTSALVTGALAPNLNGVYKPGATPGAQGVFHAKEPMKNFAADLNGSSGYVEVPFDQRLNLDNSLNFSVEVWVKPRSGSVSAPQVVISSHHISAGGNQRGYEIALVPSGGSHPAVRGRVFSTNAAAPTEITLTPTQGDAQGWRHIVLGYGRDVGGGPILLHLYVSVAGTAVTLHGSVAPEYQPVQQNQGRALRFGAGHQQPAEPAVDFFNGLIDEVAFYHATLPQTTVEAHFKAL